MTNQCDKRVFSSVDFKFMFYCCTPAPLTVEYLPVIHVTFVCGVNHSSINALNIVYYTYTPATIQTHKSVDTDLCQWDGRNLSCFLRPERKQTHTRQRLVYKTMPQSSKVSKVFPPSATTADVRKKKQRSDF